jgi:invasion protein IalB
VNHLLKFVFAATVAAAAATSGGADAQQATKAKTPAASAPKSAPSTPAASPQAEAAPAPSQPGWIARCASASRDAPLECAMEQNAVLTKTGQVIVVVNIRIAPDTRSPVALVQLPLGLNLPAGAKVQVDDGKSADLQIQTCEQRGCFANAPIATDMLAAMKTGTQFKVSFQNLAKETITIPMSLTDFAAAYDKIK